MAKCANNNLNISNTLEDIKNLFENIDFMYLTISDNNFICIAERSMI